MERVLSTIAGEAMPVAGLKMYRLSWVIIVSTGWHSTTSHRGEPPPLLLVKGNAPATVTPGSLQTRYGLSSTPSAAGSRKPATPGVTRKYAALSGCTINPPYTSPESEGDVDETGVCRPPAAYQSPRMSLY